VLNLGEEENMLTNSMVYPTITVKDLKRSREFFEKKLGLKAVAEDPSGGITFQVGMTSMLYIYTQTSSTVQCDHTLAAFVVDNIESEVKDLKNKGVKFEDYDIPQMKIKTMNSIATMGDMKGAWFKDPDGNIFGLMEYSPATKKKMMDMMQTVGASPSR
jgi:catechol 2,3-dioxygenase-like lactoylglutathione lyase family enzyme